MSFDNEPGSDPLSAVFNSRRIPHGRSGNNKGKGRNKGGSNSASSAFNPLRALGYYEVQVGSSKAKSKAKGRGKGGRVEQQEDTAVSWFEVHQLTEGDDGFVATFGFMDVGTGTGTGTSRVEGMALLAGSRKGLQRIVNEIEDESSEEDEDADEAKDHVAKHDSGDEVDNDNEAEHESQNDDNNDEEEEDEQENKTPPPPPQPPSPNESTLEAADARLNARHRAFEKNSFRNPKFWIRWKGRVHHATPPPSPSSTHPDINENVETNQGYLTFASNACDRFDGTISCEALGWDNLKISGWKVRSKARQCVVAWEDF